MPPLSLPFFSFHSYINVFHRVSSIFSTEIEKREEGVIKLEDEEAEEMSDNPAGM